MFEAKSGWITRAAFEAYNRGLHLPERNPGSVGLGYSVFARRSEWDDLARAYEASNGEPLEIWPAPSDDFVAVAVMFESSEPGASRASGFDAYSDPPRRAAIDRAMASARSPYPVRSPRSSMVANRPNPTSTTAATTASWRTSSWPVKRRRRRLIG